jgi:SAM-dependent methyltransferase
VTGLDRVRIDDPESVRTEYATDAGLAARIAAFRFAEGPDARDVVFDAVAEARPTRLLEVGCGQGVLAERIARELGVDVVAVDQSQHMVDLTQARGVEALLGDVLELPFGDAEFDVGVAAWMLYHVADVDRALGELARVLRPGGRLVAATNGAAHMQELAALLGVEREPSSFSRENGEQLLRSHFARVERRDAFGSVVFPSVREAQEYVDASVVFAAHRLPELDGPLRVTTAPVVFVAERV